MSHRTEDTVHKSHADSDLAAADSLPTVIVRPGEADRLLSGHPWLYKSSVLRLTRSAVDGELVQVKDHRQRLLGSGFYNGSSKIAVRLLSNDRIQADAHFFRERIHQALAHRRRYMPKATSFRVVNAESDFMSGLIVDKYEDTAVIQISSLGMEQRKAMIVEAVYAALKPKLILERSEAAARRFEGMEASQGVLRGEASEALDQLSLSTVLNGLRFEVPWGGGHKTGLYLDQQMNYQAAARWSEGAQVLDCFSFIGGFALHAAKGKAAHVHGLDQSAEAINAASRNAQSNHLQDSCSFECANVFDWLKSQTQTRPNEKVIPRFDLIILDPPSFTRTRDSVPDALRGYKEIHLRALKLLKPNGTLLTYCCSHHVDRNTFEAVILDAAYDAHRVLRRVDVFGQSPDHPVIPTIPETEYLKGFAFEIAR